MCSNEIEELKRQLKEKDLIINALKDELKKKVAIDHLTGMFNKSVVHKILEIEANKVERTLESFSIIIVCVDQLSGISNVHGREVSDDILSEVGIEIQDALRKQDIISRWGNDEFLIILPETNKTQARNVEEVLIKKLKKYIYNYKGDEIHYKIITGVAKYNLGESVNECLVKAEEEIKYNKNK